MDFVIEWKDKKYTVKENSVFGVLERWEDELNLTTFGIFSWAGNGQAIKPLKAAKAFGILLESAGCNDYDVFEVTREIHNPNGLQASLIQALFSVASSVMPPADFIQGEEGAKKKESENPKA